MESRTSNGDVTITWVSVGAHVTKIMGQSVVGKRIGSDKSDFYKTSYICNSYAHKHSSSVKFVIVKTKIFSFRCPSLWVGGFFNLFFVQCRVAYLRFGHNNFPRFSLLQLLIPFGLIDVSRIRETPTCCSYSLYHAKKAECLIREKIRGTRRSLWQL